MILGEMLQLTSSSESVWSINLENGLHADQIAALGSFLEIICYFIKHAYVFLMMMASFLPFAFADAFLLVVLIPFPFHYLNETILLKLLMPFCCITVH